MFVGGCAVTAEDEGRGCQRKDMMIHYQCVIITGESVTEQQGTLKDWTGLDWTGLERERERENERRSSLTN
jgi:hypothetical protein